jgi:hypothetical protein
MTIEKLNNDAVNIAATSLIDFVQDILAVYKSGYVLDLSTENGVPQNIGYLYAVTMFPAKEESIEVDDVYKEVPAPKKTTEVSEDDSEDKPTLNDVFKPVKAGRPAKNK